MGSGRGPSPARGLSRRAFLFFSSFFFFQRKRKRKRNLTGKYGFGPGPLPCPGPFPLRFSFLFFLFLFPKKKEAKKKSDGKIWVWAGESSPFQFPHFPFSFASFLFSKRKEVHHPKGNQKRSFPHPPGRRWFSFAYFSFFQKKSRGSRHIRSGAFMPSRPRPTATTWRAASVRARRALRTAGSSAMMRRS